MDVVVVIAAYLQDCEVRGMSPRSLPGYKSALKDFSNYLDSIGSDIIKTDKNILKGYLEHSRQRGLSPRSIELTFSVLSSFFEFMVFEGKVSLNPVPAIRKRYLQAYKNNADPHERQLISIEDAARMIKAEPDIRNKALLTMLFDGMRRNQLITLDVSDVDLVENTIRLKPTGKRTNRTLFLDDESAYLLRRWLRVREGINRKKESALFLSSWANRISRNDVYQAVTNAAERVGRHDPELEEEIIFSHNCRHWMTTP